MSKWFLVLVTILMAACTPAHIVRSDMPSDPKPAKVTVHRVSGFNAGGAALVFGRDEQDLVGLRQQQYAEILLNPGTYVFFTRSTGADRPYQKEVAVAAGEEKCMRAYPNPNNFMKAMLSVITFSLPYYLGNTFLLEEIQCPNSQFYSDYKMRKIEYKQN